MNDDNMNAIDAIMTRSSVRKFIDKPVEVEKLDIIIRAAMSAPSGKNMQPWEFVIVDKRNLLDEMAEGLPYAKMLSQSQLAIIVCGKPSVSDNWSLDCAAATENILIAVKAIGLGAVWTAAYPYPERIAVVCKALNIPEDVVPLCVIPIGYPMDERDPKDKYNTGKIHRNTY